MNRLGKERDYGSLARWITVVSSVVLLVAVIVGISRFGGRSSELSVASVERAIRSSVVQCYALEGSYPPSLEYLEKNYGLLLDRARYVFLYEVPGANLAPIVGVTVR
jgi:hypothetical protein